MPYLGNRPDNIVIRNAQQEFNYTATSSQTTFTGLDSNNNTLAYNPGNVEVFFNGARLEEADFTATNGTSIVLASAAATNDLVSIVSTDVFEVTDTVSRQNGGTFIGDVTMSGNLTVNGTTTSVNSNEVNIGDNILKLNSDETGTPSQNAGIEVERGSATNVAFRWNEATDKWQFTNDGSSYIDLGESDLVGDTTPQLGGNLLSNGHNIKLADSDQIVLGSDNDCNIKHTGTNLNINETTGEINIRTYADDQDVVISTDDGSGGVVNYIRADGSTGEVKLYHYGSLKLATKSSGATITGTLTASTKLLVGTTTPASFSTRLFTVGDTSFDDTALEIRSSTGTTGRIYFTDASDTSSGAYKGGIIYDQANDFMRFETNGNNERLRIDSSGDVTTKGRGFTVDNSDASWHAINIAESIDSRIAFRITPSRNGQTKGISMGSIGQNNTDTGLQAYDTSNNTANDFLINPWGGNVGIGIASGPGTSLHIRDAITNPNTISSNMTIPANSNSMMAGPITLNATVTIPNGSSWTIV